MNNQDIIVYNTNNIDDKNRILFSESKSYEINDNGNIPTGAGGSDSLSPASVQQLINQAAAVGNINKQNFYPFLNPSIHKIPYPQEEINFDEYAVENIEPAFVNENYKF
ncbi:hypothetical protein H1Q59_06245 [Holosporaceae bacterium 'Namur']|nr:hypothetical protein [Holosporaceae bacterium 'Namur']